MFYDSLFLCNREVTDLPYYIQLFKSLFNPEIYVCNLREKVVFKKVNKIYNFGQNLVCVYLLIRVMVPCLFNKPLRTTGVKALRVLFNSMQAADVV